jgi:sulfite dehydrogenase (quinone) subunit SoeC
MKPAWSIILFTTIAGAAQGIVVAAAAATLRAAALPGTLALMLGMATAMLLAALVASFFHLGHPLRAWRAVLMWRTSWMSREVIALPAFIALVASWAILVAADLLDEGLARLIAMAAIFTAVFLWYCTAMIYACIRFIQEWAHPLTIVNYMMLGLASGLVTAGALGVIANDEPFVTWIGPWAVMFTLFAWMTRWTSLHRNAGLKPKSTVQSATGIQSSSVVQKSMGFTGGSFNTRAFFHGASPTLLRLAKPAFQILVFALPTAFLLWSEAFHQPAAWLLAAASQGAGLLIERWFFFAQAKHPQNIYYQAVS